MISICRLPCSVLASVMVYSDGPVNYSCKLLITLTPGVSVFNKLGLHVTVEAAVMAACILPCCVHASVMVYSATAINYSCKLFIGSFQGPIFFPLEIYKFP